MDKKFEVQFLEEAIEFLQQLDEKSREKVIYNIDKASYFNDPKLFKKLNESIWEFRTLYNKKQHRILAFWDKEDDKETLVLATHGFIKKTSKIQKSDLKKAEEIRKQYFIDKSKS